MEKFGYLFQAANALGIRQDLLSGLLSGKRPLTEKHIQNFEEALGAPRTSFLPPDFAPYIKKKPGRPRTNRLNPGYKHLKEECPPLPSLREFLLEEYGLLHWAADDLGLRMDQLSSILSGRLPLTEELIVLLESRLVMPRKQFLPEGFVPYVKRKGGFGAKNNQDPGAPLG